MQAVVANEAAEPAAKRFEVWLNVTHEVLTNGAPYVTYRRVLRCASRADAERLARKDAGALVLDIDTGEVWEPARAA